MKLLSICLILIIQMLASASWAADQRTSLVLGAEDSWPPFSKEDGTGLSNQIIAEAYATQGINVSFTVAPYARQLAATKAGTLVGVFNVTKEPSTESTFLFCEEKLFTATTAYFYHEDAPLKAHSYQELRSGEKIGMIIGYEYGPYIIENPNVKKYRVAKQQNLIKMLLNNRLDGVIMFDAIAQYTLPQIEGSEKIKRAFDGEHSDIYVAFSKSHEDAPYFCKMLDAGLKSLKEKGRIKEILSLAGNS